jgi:DNA-binding NtrC family response regulator
MTEIVYIDDEPALLRAMSLVLESVGLSVAAYESPEEAVVFINGNEVGVVFCDYRMPKMTGLQVLRALDKEVPFYLISGDLQIEDEVKNEARLTGFLAKPLSPFAVVDLAKKALGKDS